MEPITIGFNDKGTLIKRVPPPADHDPAQWLVKWELRKFEGDLTPEQADQAVPYEVIEGEGNLLVTNGANLLWTALIGGAITAFSNANARLGVGDSNTAAAVSQTDLQAATNKTRVAMDGGYPSVSTNQTQWRSTFGSGVAEWAGGWQEWAIFNAASGATSMLNRVVANLGVKGASTTWQLLVTTTLA
jgi:hypothetical protein